MPRIKRRGRPSLEDEEEEGFRMGPMETAAHLMCQKLGTAESHIHRREYMERLMGTWIEPETDQKRHDPSRHPIKNYLTHEQTQKLYRLWASCQPMDMIRRIMGTSWNMTRRAVDKLEKLYPEVSERRNLELRKSVEDMA